MIVIQNQKGNYFMRIQNVTPNATPAFAGKFIVPAKENKHVELLYNKLSKTVKENKLPAIFYTDRVEISSYKHTDDIVTKTLDSFGIKFKSADKN